MEFLTSVPKKNQIRIQFESLVKNPEKEINRICQWLNIAYSTEMLDPYSNQKDKMTDGIHEVGLMIGDPKFHDHQKIDAQVADEWRNHVKEDFLSDYTWKIAQKLGYDPINSAYFQIQQAEQKAYYPLLTQQSR